MKKYSNIFLSFLLLIFVFLAGCSKEEENKEIGLEEDANIVLETIKEENSCLQIESEEQTIVNQEASTEQKVLNLNLHHGIATLHPSFVDDVYESWILQHTFEGLYTKDTEGKNIPGMAKDYKVSEDGLTWTFYLNEDRKWSNGDPVTANDFEYAWKFLLKETAAQMNHIANAQEYKKGQVSEDEVGIHAVDDCTLEVKLVYNLPSFLDYIALGYYPINKKVQEENRNWADKAETYVSNGAFKLTEMTQEGIKLVRNERYNDADKIHLDVVNFSMIDEAETILQKYKAGEIDLVHQLFDELGQLADKENPEFFVEPKLSVGYISINTDKIPFNNVKVRKALAKAISPAPSLVPPGIKDVQGDFFENSGILIEENVQEAKKLLIEGLTEEGLPEMPEITYLYSDTDSAGRTADYLQSMWKDNLGITVKIEGVEWQVLQARAQASEYDLLKTGNSSGVSNPSSFLGIWVTGNQSNYSNYSNLEYDSLISEANETIELEKKMEILHKAHKLILDDMPVIPLHYSSKRFLVKQYVTGIYTPIETNFPMFKYADIDMSKK